MPHLLVTIKVGLLTTSVRIVFRLKIFNQLGFHSAEIPYQKAATVLFALGNLNMYSFGRVIYRVFNLNFYYLLFLTRPYSSAAIRRCLVTGGKNAKGLKRAWDKFNMSAIEYADTVALFDRIDPEKNSHAKSYWIENIFIEPVADFKQKRAQNETWLRITLVRKKSTKWHSS